MSEEEGKNEALNKSLSNNAEELEIIKHELQDKITALAETHSELESLRNLVSDNQTQSDDVQEELVNARAALVESETLVRSLNESLTENAEEMKELQRVKDSLMETQSVLGELHIVFFSLLPLLTKIRLINFRFV